MTRQEAVSAIYEVINSGIIDTELENRLTEACRNICSDEWEDCKKEQCSEYCDGCDFKEDFNEEEFEDEEELDEESEHTLSVGVKPPRKI